MEPLDGGGLLSVKGLGERHVKRGSKSSTANTGVSFLRLLQLAMSTRSKAVHSVASDILSVWRRPAQPYGA